jgi:hypothetical protein
MRAWLIGGDGAVVARREGVGFAGLAGGETGVVDVRLELGPGGVLGYRWGNECNTAGAEAARAGLTGRRRDIKGATTAETQAGYSARRAARRGEERRAREVLERVKRPGVMPHGCRPLALARELSSLSQRV